MHGPTESSPLSATITDTALSRTGEDSSLFRNCHDKSRRGMSHRSCSACLRRALGRISGGRPPAEAQTGRGQLRSVGLTALAGSGQEMETYSHLTGVHQELLSPAVEAARGTRAKAMQPLEGRLGKEHFLACHSSACVHGRGFYCCSVFSLRT